MAETALWIAEFAVEISFWMDVRMPEAVFWTKVLSYKRGI
jgi:hypothetical protein